MKRFTATEKWACPWYQDLSPTLKCLWQYLWDNADATGVWEPNWKLATFSIGKAVTDADLVHFAGRVVKAKGGKVVIREFIEFQYGKLSEECRAHIPIFRLLEKHRVSIGYDEAIHSLKEQEQEKDKEEDKEEGMQGERGIVEKSPPPEPKPTLSRGTLDDIKAFGVELGLPASDGEACFHKWEGNGWKNGNAPIKNWRATIRSWKAAGYMPSQKTNGNGRKAAGAEAPQHTEEGAL